MKQGGALSYLLLTKLKNRVKSFLKSPGKLIYLIIVVLLLGLVFFSGNMGGIPVEGYRPQAEVTAMVTALYAVMFFLLVYGGFSNGGSFFNMPDVNLIFPAPLKPQHALLYGLCQQMGTSLMVGVFLLFQYSWMHQVYGVTAAQLVVILLGYAVTVFLGQTVALVLYASTSGDEQKRRIAQGVFFAVLFLAAAWVVFSALNAPEGLLSGAVAAANSLPLHLLPLAGWMSWAAYGALTGNLLALTAGIVLSAAGLVLVVLFMTRTHTDFYEDVLKSAETVQSAITARKEGMMTEAAPRNVKVGKRGVRKGWGASVFFHKHMLEDRRGRVFLFSPVDLVFILITIGFGLFAGRAIAEDTAVGSVISVFADSVYMQIFSTLKGSMNKELTKPYLYLVPEPPFRKLLYFVAEGLPAAVLEAVVIFLPLCIILDWPAVLTAVLMVGRVTYSVLFTAANLAVERIWGGSGSRMIVMLLYIAIVLVMVAPGVLLAVVLTLAAALPLVSGLLILAAVNVAVSLFVIFLCRNMLEVAELNQQ